MSPDLKRGYCGKLLERAGLSSQAAARYAAASETKAYFYALERAARLLESMRDEEVLPHVAISLVRKALDTDPTQGDGREMLDWCEIACELCRERKRGSQSLRNPAGFIMKIIKDVEGRRRFVSEDQESSYKKRFRQREEAALRQEQEAEERTLILEYERFRQAVAAQAFADLSDEERNALRKSQGRDPEAAGSLRAYGCRCSRTRSRRTDSERTGPLGSATLRQMVSPPPRAAGRIAVRTERIVSAVS